MKLYSKIYELLNKKINLSKEGIIALGLASITIVSSYSLKKIIRDDSKTIIVENIDYELDKTIKEINQENIYEITFFENTLTIKENKKSNDYSKIKYLFKLLKNQKLQVNYIPCNNVNIDFSEIDLDNCSFEFTFSENKINKKRLSKIIENIPNCTSITINTDEPNYIDEIIKIINLIGNNNSDIYKSVLINNKDSKLINNIINCINEDNRFDSFTIKSSNCNEYFGNLGKINSTSINIIVSDFDYSKEKYYISFYTDSFKLYCDDGKNIKLIYEYKKNIQLEDISVKDEPVKLV